jgi:hypothetical protein
MLALGFRGCPWDGRRNRDLRPGSWLGGAGGFNPVLNAAAHACLHVYNNACACFLGFRSFFSYAHTMYARLSMVVGSFDFH